MQSQLRILPQMRLNLRNAMLNLVTIVDVNMSNRCHLFARLLITLNNFMKQRLNSFACLKHRGQHSHAQEFGKLFKINVVAALLRFIKHIQSTNHGHVHIDKLRREVKITLQIATVNDIDDHVGILLNELFAHIKFLGRIGR